MEPREDPWGRDLEYDPDTGWCPDDPSGWPESQGQEPICGVEQDAAAWNAAQTNSRDAEMDRQRGWS